MSATNDDVVTFAASTGGLGSRRRRPRQWGRGAASAVGGHAALNLRSGERSCEKRRTSLDLGKRVRGVRGEGKIHGAHDCMAILAGQSWPVRGGVWLVYWSTILI